MRSHAAAADSLRRGAIFDALVWHLPPTPIERSAKRASRAKVLLAGTLPAFFFRSCNTRHRPKKISKSARNEKTQ